jgi:hypothetical protein
LIAPAIYTSQWGVKNYLRTRPDDVAIACLDPRNPADGFYHNADEAYPLASTFKIVLLAAYAREVAAGRLDAGEAVPLGDLETWYLPETDGGAHPEFLNSLGEGRETASLDEVVDGMIVYSSNAATDYIHARLENVDFDALYQRLGLEHTTQPVSILGLYLAMNNHEQGAAKINGFTPETLLAAREKYEGAFLSEPAWRQAELDFVANTNNFAPLNVQKWFLGIYGMGGSARDMAKVMLAAYGYSDALNPEAQAIMRRHLEWPLRVYPENAQDFKILATKSGAWPAILTSAWYAEPQNGEPRVLVVLYANMRDDYWNTWLASFSHQEFEASILKDADCSVLAETIK